jgi:hypothetical protein
MRQLKNILYILTLISLPITVTLGIVYSNPFIYGITLALLGITWIVHNKYHSNMSKETWSIVKQKDIDDELLYQAFLADEVKNEDTE